ncbi:MAG TPA: hypothetical protein VN956_02465 [Pyrinomonadaceae bacterium]|nr:hypothetical protein [Pyrinomonadaceae bacterium]
MNSDDSVNLDDLVIEGEDLSGLELEPRTWYSFVQAQVDLLRAHVHGLENQIDESVKAYEKEKAVTDFEEYDDGYAHIILEEHRGIEGPPNHLEEIFKYYFPNLQRRSTLIVLFSFLEHQLNQLCELLATTQKLSIVHTDLRDKGIVRSRRYLKKVICLPVDDDSVIWQQIQRIQKVRNVVVHNDAKLVNTDVINIVKESEYLCLASDSESYYYHDSDSDDDEVNILEGYLIHVLDTCDAYCGELNKAIESCLGPSIL